MICGHGHKQKFKYPYSKIIQMPYPRAKAIDQIPALCLPPPPPPPPPSHRRLDINRCINYIFFLFLSLRQKTGPCTCRELKQGQIQDFSKE